MEIRFIDMFCGIGGFRLGLEKANIITQPKEGQPEEGWNRTIGFRGTQLYGGLNPTFACAWSNDNDRYAYQIYRKHFGNRGICSQDIRTVDADALPEHDLLCAGFPCQSFSIAGKRGGFEDTRGTLFFEICRVIRAKRPGYLLLENVKGLLSHDDGSTFERIIGALDELGYDCQWQVLNSKDYGVPQNRERVFIVGHTRGKPKPKVFPIGEDGGVLGENGAEALPSLTATDWKGPSIQRPKLIVIQKTGGQTVTYKEDEVGVLQAGGANVRDKVPNVLQKIGNIRQNGKDAQAGRVYNPNGIAPTIGGEGGGEGAKTGLVVQPILTPGREKKRQHGRRMKEDGEPMFTLTGQDIHGVLMGTLTEALGTRQGSSKEFLKSVEKLGGIRRLTPLECERLQGFPDGWTEGISDTQRYKCLGNAVTVNVVEAIGRQLLSELT